MYVKDFKQLNKADVALAGGKGASLGEMTNAGIPVPEGFVVLSRAFEKFIEETDLNVEIDAILDKVNVDEIHTVEEASEKIQSLILSEEIPKDIAKDIESSFKSLKAEFVAVRSSATAEDSASAAWAGQLDSYLNVTDKNLLESVRKCWASLFTPRAIFYRIEKKLSEEKVSVAVVVQKMVNSETSGIAFSVHPVTQDENQIIIEAGFGLGEAIVSGSITPDSYVIDKQDWHLIDVNVNAQNKGLFRKSGGGNEWKDLEEKGKEQVLKEGEIIELSKLIVKIENHYGFPCDIEWAREKGKFYITQSRPITTLQKKLETEDEIDFSKYELELEQRNKHTILMSDYWGRALSSTYLEAIKLPIKKIDSIYTSKNKLYVNKKQKEKILDEIEKALNKSKDYIKYVFQATQERLKEFDNTTREISKNLKENSTNEELSILWKKFDISFLNLVPWYFIPWYMTERDILTNKIKNSLLQYQKSIEKITDFNNALMLLISPVKKTSFVREQEAYYNLLKLAQKAKNLELDERFIEETKKYLKDFDWTKAFLFLPFQPTSPEEVIQRIKTSLKEKEVEEFELKFHQQEKNKKLVENLKEIIKKDKELLNSIKSTQELGWLLTASVEDSFFSTSRIYPLFEIISKRLKITWGELNGLSSQEIIDLLENKIQIKYIDLEERKKAYIYVLEDNETKYIFGDRAVNLIKEIENQAEAIDLNVEELKGQPANPGKVSGIVKIAKTAQEANILQKGNILVTNMTSPDYVPAMKKAAAIVTDEGGLLSHAAIISREIGKPCVVGTRTATKVLKDGDLVEVDADKGVIKILEKQLNKADVALANQAYHKIMTRPLSLIDCGCWDIGERIKLPEKFKNLLFFEPLFIYTPKKAVAVYYNFTDPEQDPQRLLNHIEKNLPWFKSEKAKFDKNCQEIKELIENKTSDYKKIAKLNHEIWPMIAVANFFGSTEFFKVSNILKSFCIQIREESDDVLHPSLTYLNKLIAKKFKMGTQNISLTEILNNNLPDDVELRKREKGWAFHKGNIILKIKDYYEEKNIQIINPTKKHGDTINGSIACKGFTKGKAKVIFELSELNKVKKGDILITPMTTPEMIPALKKASAIVTDEGGITCHAAIISRELKIPCVIGTVNATKLISDNDLLEVDANKGVIKILKKT